MGVCGAETKKTSRKIQNKLDVQGIQSKQKSHKMKKRQKTGSIQNLQDKQEIKILEKDINGNISVPVNIIIKATKSVCKITIKENEKKIFGTGFFMKVSDNEKYLITNYHVISQNNINDDIEIEI